MAERGEFKYKVCDLDRVVEERGSVFMALRRIAWGYAQDDEVENPDDIKLDLRKYYATSTGERMNKGVTFISDDGAHELVHVMLEEGYGDSERCIEILKERPNFKEAVQAVYFKDDEDNIDPDADPRKLFLGE